MKKIRIISVILAVLMLFSMLVSCSSSPTVMKIGSYKVSYDMLRYFVMNYKNGYNGIAPEDFLTDEELQQGLLENTQASLRELAAYYLLAKEYKIKLTDEQKKEIESSVEALKAAYNTDEEYKADLEANFVTEDVYREILTITAYCDSLYDYLTDEVTGVFMHDDTTIMNDIEAGNFFSAEYIYVEYAETDKESKREFTEGLLERIKNGEKMASVFAEYENEYLLLADYVKLDAFTYHQQNEYFEEAVLALSENECSDIIEQPGMFIIIKRLPLSDEYIDKNFNSIIASYLSREFFEFVEDYSKKLDIEYKKKYSDLKYWEIE